METWEMLDKDSKS